MQEVNWPAGEYCYTLQWNATNKSSLLSTLEEIRKPGEMQKADIERKPILRKGNQIIWFGCV